LYLLGGRFQLGFLAVQFGGARVHGVGGGHGGRFAEAKNETVAVFAASLGPLPSPAPTLGLSDEMAG